MLRKLFATLYPAALALLLGAAIGNPQLYAKQAQGGKLTDVSGAFICDCTNSENSCSCLLVSEPG